MLDILVLVLAQTPISNQQQLADIASHLDGDYYLTQDVELQGQWAPLGPTDHSQFTGTLDGRGHTISGLFIENSDPFQGLFGYIDEATVWRLTVIGSLDIFDNYVGLMTGEATNTTFIDCHTFGFVQGGYNTGHFVGRSDSSTFLYCTANGDTVALANPGGGFAGLFYRGEFGFGGVNGTVATESSALGGLLGWVQGSAYIHDFYVSGTLNGVDVQQFGQVLAGTNGSAIIEDGWADVVFTQDVGCGIGGYGEQEYVNVYWNEASGADPCGEVNIPGSFQLPPQYCVYDLDHDGWVGPNDATLMFLHGWTIEDYLALLAAWGACEHG